MWFLLLWCVSAELVFDMEPLEAGFQELAVHRNTCTYSAVHEFVVQCRENGLDSIDAYLRLQLAVKLSVCEFTEAAVEYPESCKLLPETGAQEQYLDCVGALRGVSQFWTTYSGNYRRLRLLCYEEQMPFMKDSILDLYFNITKLYAQMFASASSSAESMKRTHNESLSKATDLRDLLSMLASDLGAFAADYAHEHRDYLRQTEEVHDFTVLRMTGLSNMLADSLDKTLDSTASLHEKVARAGQQLERMGQDVALQHDDVLGTFSAVRTAQEELHGSLSATVQLVEDVSGASEYLAELFSGALHESGLVHNNLQLLHNSLGEHFAETHAAVANLTLETAWHAAHVGQHVFAAVAPSMFRLVSLGSALDLKFTNISKTASAVAGDLSVLEEKLVLLLEILFAGIFGSITQLAQHMLAAIAGYFCLLILSRFSGRDAQTSGSALVSFVRALLYALTTAVLVRMWILRSGLY